MTVRGNKHIPYDLQILTIQQFESLAENEKMVYFSRWGLLAPTTHNTVPQKFRMLKNEVQIYLDRNLVLPESDRDGRQATISLGCVVENVVQAANEYGYLIKIIHKTIDISKTKPMGSHDTKKDALIQILSLQFKKVRGAILSKKNLESIKFRHVERGLYKEDVKITHQTWKKIKKISVNEKLGIDVQIITDKHTKYMFSLLQRQADTFIMGKPKFRKEFSEWFLPNNDILNSRGMRGYEFNLSDKATLKIYNGLVDGKLSLIEMLGFSKGSQEGIQSASAICIISTRHDSVKSRLLSGAAYERVAIMLQRKGYSTSIYAALTETGLPIVRSLTETLKATVLKTRNHPMVVFRIGKPKHKREGGPSAKPSIEQVLI